MRNCKPSTAKFRKLQESQMPTRSEMIKALEDYHSRDAKLTEQTPTSPSREEMIQALEQHAAQHGPSVPAAKSALLGVEQGSTFGLADEIAGAEGAVGEAIGVKGIGGNKFSELGFMRPRILDGDIEGIKKAYQKTRDGRRAESAEAKDANPKSYTGGE